MTKEDIKYQAYIQILKEELIPAMGCTEPIALAYAAAKAREVLGCIPERVHIGASGSIIKNVKSVVVPNTDGMRGIESAAEALPYASEWTAVQRRRGHCYQRRRGNDPQCRSAWPGGNASDRPGKNRWICK